MVQRTLEGRLGSDHVLVQVRAPNPSYGLIRECPQFAALLRGIEDGATPLIALTT